MFEKHWFNCFYDDFFNISVPMWAVGGIVVVVLVLVACVIICMIKKCFGKKKKPKKVRESKTGRRKKRKDDEGETGEKVRGQQLLKSDGKIVVATLLKKQCFCLAGGRSEK